MITTSSQLWNHSTRKYLSAQYAIVILAKFIQKINTGPFHRTQFLRIFMTPNKLPLQPQDEISVTILRNGYAKGYFILISKNIHSSTITFHPLLIAFKAALLLRLFLQRLTYVWIESLSVGRTPRIAMVRHAWHSLPGNIDNTVMNSKKPDRRPAAHLVGRHGVIEQRHKKIRRLR